MQVDVNGKNFEQARREFEARVVEETLRVNGFRKTAAAEILGISMERLRRIMAAGRGLEAAGD